MALTPRETEDLARKLWDARLGGQAIAPPSAAFEGMTIEDAYAVSRLVYERRIKLPSVRAIGKKIGLTSRAVQSQLGVSQPDFGYLTSDMRIEDGGTLPRGSLIQGKAEGEVAFVLKKDLRGPGVTREQVVAATDYVVACI